jgi:hypothetical protein
MRFEIQIKPRTPAETVWVPRLPVVLESRPMRVLDFDIENRPLSYLGHDFTTAEVTAIAWAWVDEPDQVVCMLLGEMELEDILAAFCHAYNQADMVTGHYLKGHDLPMVNGALMECRMPALADKRVQDTKLDLIRTKGLSLSQESLGAMFRLEQQKVAMNQSMWRAANRLTPEGLAYVRERAIGDVRQHIHLRRELLEHDYLTKPSLWRSGTAQLAEYTP